MRNSRKRSARRVDGYAVVDATTPLEVHVTQRDIRRGRPSACECAFAVAIKREHGAKHVRVNASRTYVEHKGVLERHPTPAGMFEQIELFDRTGDMGPGVYTIPVFSPSQALGTSWHCDNPLYFSRQVRLRKRDRPVYRQPDEK